MPRGINQLTVACCSLVVGKYKHSTEQVLVIELKRKCSQLKQSSNLSMSPRLTKLYLNVLVKIQSWCAGTFLASVLTDYIHWDQRNLCSCTEIDGSKNWKMLRLEWVFVHKPHVLCSYAYFEACIYVTDFTYKIYRVRDETQNK